jgi:glucose/arabinose dehydrogenase
MNHIAWIIAALWLVPGTVHAQLRAETVASGLSSPVAFVQDPLFSNVFFIVEQGGLVKVLIGGQVQNAPFIDFRDAIKFGGEQGLLGMAFAPDAASGRVFFNFTDVNGHTVVVRATRSAADPFRADTASVLALRWPSGEHFIRQPFVNHNGGYLAFGPDGYLYIALGDGGSANDPENNAQNPASLLGKILRIDVNVPDGDPVGYRVPGDNPFVDGQPIPALPEIWAFGLRNPWRYSFDDLGPGATNGLFIGDVGQDAREEVNFEPANSGGRNYGWRLREGRIPTAGVPAAPSAFLPLSEPIFDYERSFGQAVTGGFVYRGAALGSSYRGRYFFADFVSSRVWSVALAFAGGTARVTDVAEHTAELGGALGGVASFARDRQGELYVLTFAGRVLKIVPEGSGVPAAPQNVDAAVTGSTVTVTWLGPSTGSVPAGYRLEAGSAPGGSDIGVVAVGGTQTSLTFNDVPDGSYFVRVRSLDVAGNGAASREIVVVVGGGCPPPPAPASLTAAVSGRTVTLTWAAPQDPTQFVIEAGSVSGAADLATLAVAGSARTLGVTAPPGIYFVRIRAASACGTSGPSNEIAVSVF